jgi:HEAT repeat protein
MSGNRKIREEAVQQLTLCGLPVVQALIEMLREPSLASEGVLEALQRIGKPAIPLLVNALRDLDDSMQRRVATPLSRMDPCPIEELTAALGDDAEHLRHGALRALGEIPDWATKESAAERFVKGLVDEKLPHEETQKALMGFREAALRPLARALPFQKARGQGLIGYTLHNMRGITLEPLQAMLYDRDPEAQIGAVQALGWIGGPEAASLLRVKMSDTDARVRKAVIDAFVKIGASDGEQLLIDALQDKNKRTRWTAAQALARMGGERARDALRQRQAKERVEEVKDAIGEALQELVTRLPG